MLSRGLVTVLVVALLTPGVVSANESSLIEVVKRGDTQGLRSLLRGSAKVNAAEPDGTTALHWAAYGGSPELVRALLSAGANANAVNRYQVTPLSLAAENGNVAVIEALLQAGANVNTTLSGGETVLMTAARTGRVDAVRTLLTRGADVNAREASRGQTALMWAAAEGHAAAITVLVEAGADVHARSRGPVAQPPEQPEDKTAYLRDYRRKNRMDALTPLLFTAQMGRIDAARALLDKGANVDDAANGTSALMLALVNQHWELAALLLDRGANPNEHVRGWTPLHQIARSRTLNTQEFPQPVPTGRVGNLDLVKKLLSLGADIEARMTVNDMDDGYTGGFNRHDATPLVLAAHGADHEMMALLLANGADPQARSKTKSSILMMAAGVEIGQLGVTGGTNEDALLAVQVALKAGGLDVNEANSVQDTALHGAAARGSAAIIELLVKHGARLDTKDINGCTAIRMAQGDRHGCGANARLPRPEAFALLERLMTERGLPIEIRTSEEIHGMKFQTSGPPKGYGANGEALALLPSAPEPSPAAPSAPPATPAGKK